MFLIFDLCEINANCDKHRKFTVLWGVLFTIYIKRTRKKKTQQPTTTRTDHHRARAPPGPRLKPAAHTSRIHIQSENNTHR